MRAAQFTTYSLWAAFILLSGCSSQVPKSADNGGDVPSQTAVSAAASAINVGVMSHWVRPPAKHIWTELSPTERTRPIIVGDILYSASFSGDVFALHRTEGYVLWHKKMPAGVDGCLAYGRSLIVVGDIKGNLFALNARDGSESWRFKVDAEWLSPAAITRGRVVAITATDDLYALGDTDGIEKWHYAHRGDEKMTIRGTAAPTIYGNEVFQGFSDGYLVALSAGSGRELWKKKLATHSRFYDVDYTAYADEQMVIAATYDGNLYSLDRLTGNTNWIFPAGSYSGGLVEQDRLYVPGLNHEFYALNKSNGQILWKLNFKTGVGMTPARAGEYLVLTTTADPTYVVDPRDGKVVWSGALGAGTFASPAADPDGWFYCLSNFGNLYSFQVGNFNMGRRGPRTHHAPSALRRSFGEPLRNNISS